MLDPLNFKQPLMLDIGAGGYSSDDKFTSVDLFTECDITAPMWDIPLPDGSVDTIFSSNALEHISKHMVVPTLREWWRLLKENGKLQVIVPDLEWACYWWLDHQDTDWSMDIIYGHQKHDGEYHKTGFTMKLLNEYFEQTDLPWKHHAGYYLWGDDKVQELKKDVYKHDVTQRVISWETEKVLFPQKGTVNFLQVVPHG